MSEPVWHYVTTSDGKYSGSFCLVGEMVKCGLGRLYNGDTAWRDADDISIGCANGGDQHFLR
jgi:hypothetical protein